MRYVNKVLGVVVAIIVPLAIYFAAYYATVGTALGWRDNTYIDVIVVPRYSVGGEFAEFAFAPAHRLDVMLRPDLWKGWKAAKSLP